MKILQVCTIFLHSVASGSTKVAYDISQELSRRGHSVTVYTTDMRDMHTKIHCKFEKEGDVSIYRFRSIGTVAAWKLKIFITPNIVWKLRNNVRLCDVIHLHEYYTFQNIIVHYFAKRYGVPYVLQVHGSIPRIQKKFAKWLYNVVFGHRILRDASKVIALSENEVQHYRTLGVSEERIAVIPNGIDLSEYENLPPKGSFKKKFNIPENNRIILYLGRIHKTKGIDLLVKAYAYLVKSMRYDDALLVIAGPDDGYLAEIKSLSAYLNVSDSVRFTGFISTGDKLKALVDADVFVTPSFYGFPVTFLEAGITGTPIVTTSLGDTLDWIEGRAGYVASPTCHEFARAIHAILSNDDLRQEFSKNSRRITQSEFSSVKVIDRLEQVYQEVARK